MKTIFPSAMETLHRKVSRSLAQRGVLRTAQRCVAKPWELLRSCVSAALPREQHYRADELDFDRRHNIDTRSDWDPSWLARIASPNWRHGIGYAPVPADDLMTIIAGLGIEYQRYVFVDLGAGKGRAVLLASHFPFRQIVGVEYSPALADVMKANIASYRNPQQRCSKLIGVLQDATQYELPQEDLVLFFHHPFDAVVFREIRNRIEQSLASYPRRILVIYYDPQCEAVFHESSSFRLRDRGGSRGRFAASCEWAIYESQQAESCDEAAK